MKKLFTAAINGYPAPISPRQGSLNDLADLQTTLSTKRGFTQFSSVTEGAATRSNIMAGLQALVSGAYSGDSIMFAFFGHGTPGGICPYDTNSQTGANVIYDHEIGAILAGLQPGVTYDVLLGCCYAGTGTRALAITSGCSPILDGKEKAPKVKKLIKAQPFNVPVWPKVSVPVGGLNHCLFAASSEGGLAWEVRMTDGSIRGLHTSGGAMPCGMHPPGRAHR